MTERLGTHTQLSTMSRTLWVFSSVQSLSHVWLLVTLWTTVRHASLSITNSQSPPKPMSVVSVMPSSHLILSSPSPPALNLPQHQGLFKWVSSPHQVAKVLEFQLQHQSLQWTPRTDVCDHKNVEYMTSFLRKFSDPVLEMPGQVFTGGPVAKTLLPRQEARVRSLVRELDPTCHN